MVAFQHVLLSNRIVESACIKLHSHNLYEAQVAR